MMKARPENKRLVQLVDELSKDKRAFWRRVAELLAKPKRQRVAINLSKIDKYAKDGATVIVPGKVLGNGELTKTVIVAAFAFSESAKDNIKKTGGRALRLEDAYNELKDLKDIILLI